jgi:RNA ligase
MMNLDLTILNKYVEDGLIIKTDHPSLPLSIYNYSRKTQYDGKWDDVTLQCRGLVVDNSTNKILVRPFKKFFNYEELEGNKFKESKLPKTCDYVYVQEKMDGSLGILFHYNGEWVMSTRGSFVSGQAIKGLEILKSKYNLDSWMKEYGYLVEILYPENRIVVEYDEEKVVFLSVVLNESYTWEPTNDTELHWTTACAVLNANGVKKDDIVKTEQHFNYSEELFSSLKEKNEENKEGFVLRFQPGNLRIKIKFEEYVRLHRLMTQISTYDIWEHLKDGKDILEILNNVPDEFDQWVKQTASTLSYHHYMVGERCGKSHDYFRYGKYSDRDPQPTKKEFAEHVQKNVNKNLHGIMFAIWDGKRDKVDELTWKLIKPKYSKPFWKKETE